jgi:hypothetical protein
VTWVSARIAPADTRSDLTEVTNMLFFEIIGYIMLAGVAVLAFMLLMAGLGAALGNLFVAIRSLMVWSRSG